MESDVIIEKLVRRGAEANLFYGSWFGKKALFKIRIPKKYRLNVLDKKIRRTRTVNEAKALIKVKLYGINVPEVFEINFESSTIIMQFIQGEKLKDLMKSLNLDKKQKLFRDVGRQIAILHINGHIHGDITTSNMIVTSEENVFLIDFGLHEYSDTIEDKSVDLHLLKRVLISSHGDDFKPCFDAFLEGYKTECMLNKIENYPDIIKNIAVIETRGRYINKKVG
jgi:TP53 regulating kinase-like protein